MATFEFPKKMCDQVGSRLTASPLHLSLDCQQGTRPILDAMTSESPHVESSSQPGKEESQVMHAQASIDYANFRHAVTLLDIVVSFDRLSTMRPRQILT